MLGSSEEEPALRVNWPQRTLFRKKIMIKKTEDPSALGNLIGGLTSKTVLYTSFIAAYSLIFLMYK